MGLEIRRSRAGIGRLSEHEEKERKENVIIEMRRLREEDLVQDFGSRKKTHWRSRRILWDFRKAEAALSQLENREVLEPEISGDDEQKKKEEEEEEVNVTEEVKFCWLSFSFTTADDSSFYLDSLICVEDEGIFLLSRMVFLSVFDISEIVHAGLGELVDEAQK